MKDKYYCPECRYPDLENYYRTTCPRCGADLRKYRVHHGRDFNPQTLGSVVDQLAELILADVDKDTIIEAIDQLFLWGAWGHIIGRSDPLLAADLRGIIVAMYRKGLKDGASVNN